MSLAEAIEKHKHLKNPKFKCLDLTHSKWVTIIFEDKGHYWAKTDWGNRITITPDMAAKGWALHLEKRKEKWSAYFNRKTTRIEWLNEHSDFSADSDVYRLEEYDVELEVTE